MKFIGRENELLKLQQEYARESGFVVLYGRRRVGKTTLIKKFIENKNALYFLATESVEKINIKRFTKAVAKFAGTPALANAQFDNWEDVFQIIADYNPNEKKIVVIDELPYIAKVNPAFPSILQYVWDEFFKGKNIMLILCGSYIGMMEKYTLVYDSPLYGRRTSQIKLKPLPFSVVCSAYNAHGGGDFEKNVEEFAITGGVPQYIEFFKSAKDKKSVIDREILSPTGYFYDEPAFLLKDEVKEVVTYYSIIETIANGNHKIGKIASILGTPTNTLSPYLDTLLSLGFVEKRLPITENNPEKSKKGLYYISDNFVRFWFNYVFPNKSDLEIDNKQTVLEELDKTFISKFVAFAYEDVCKEIFLDLWRKEEIPFSPSKVGSYWENDIDTDMQIDVVAVDNSNKQVFFGECKYHEKPVDADVYFNLKAKVGNNKELNRIYKDFKFIYGVFSKSGFTRRLIDTAKENDTLWLIDKDKRV